MNIEAAGKQVEGEIVNGRTGDFPEAAGNQIAIPQLEPNSGMDNPQSSSVNGEDPNGLPLWKRLLDLAIIVALAPALFVFGAGVALVVAVGSPGPIFFRQRRVGYKGRHFTCYKFRTMKVNAETASHQHHTRQLIGSETPMTKLDSRSDPRLVPFGTALRLTGLDELPQLFNVLRGEMSVVGPRPCIPYEYELYEPWQRRRFDAVPGLTGLWQVSGKNRTTFNRMIQLDLEYSQRLSLWLDLKIILMTLPALWQQCLDNRELKRKQARPAGQSMAKSVELYRL
jgi:lipopolysaccharide/colanic/teichoic acid biosynthesis glycosyltransferase